MGNKSKKTHVQQTSSSSSPLSSESSDDSELYSKRWHRHRKDREKSDGSSRKQRGRKREREETRRKKRERRDKERERKKRKSRAEYKKKDKKKRRRGYESESSSASKSGSESDSESERSEVEPQAVVKEMFREFPTVGNDLKQLLQMIDEGQAVDIKGISEKSLIKHLKRLFFSLNLKENGDGVFLLPLDACPTLDVIEPLIRCRIEPKEQQLDDGVSKKDVHQLPVDVGCKQVTDSNTESHTTEDSFAPRRRMIGPEMPSAELLAAAAKLTEAQAELRYLLTGKKNKRDTHQNFPCLLHQVTRIMGVEADCPYEILGTNRNMSADNIKKKYWKLSLLVHPDKCSHPQAHQAFILLNKAFKELQDPDRRKALDEKIKLKEEQEEFKAELQAMQEAAKWRRLQGISMEGDDELLATMEVKVAPQRDEWMTTLPPERQPGGVTTQTTKFSKSYKGRGDTSVWTDTPSERAQKAKMNYLEAYNEAAALASNEEESRRSSDADLVDKYNKEKRSKSLVEKHQEEASGRAKKKSRQPPEKEEWVGQHPWKPWDREKDLVAGRQNIKFDAESMSQGLASRFSSGNFQRNFL
ncbi:uncharacterized protein LOC110813255 [Carica papaya]|uniref:uncharacterized protein LOC110813255 n=1 Tax=Carica papaya TaxID=3649 RepID=UPI000B8CEF11|nr:uncharacterized protein LOC110813255 [Carica papaya]